MSAGRAGSALRVVRRPVALGALLAALGVFHVWSHTRVTAAGYRLGELQREQEALRAERDRLEVEVATLRAPGRLEAFARARFKMAPPAPGAVVAARAGVVAAADGTGGWGVDVHPAPAEPVVQARVALGSGRARPQAE